MSDFNDAISLDFAAWRLPVRPNTRGILDGVSEA